MPQNQDILVQDASFTNEAGVRVSASRRLDASIVPSRVDLQVGNLRLSANSGSSKGIGENDGVRDYVMINGTVFAHPTMARELGAIVNDALRDGRIDAREARELATAAQGMKNTADRLYGL